MGICDRREDSMFSDPFLRQFLGHFSMSKGSSEALSAAQSEDGVILPCPHTESVGQLQQTMVIRAAPRSEGAGHVLFAWDDGVASMQLLRAQS